VINAGILVLAGLTSSDSQFVAILRLKADREAILGRSSAGNAGTTNVYRQAGPGLGGRRTAAGCGRALAAARTGVAFSDYGRVPWIGLSLVAGNRYPCFHGFQGGRGLPVSWVLPCCSRRLYGLAAITGSSSTVLSGFPSSPPFSWSPPLPSVRLSRITAAWGGNRDHRHGSADFFNHWKNMAALLHDREKNDENQRDTSG